jgi:hypothetical protein
MTVSFLYVGGGLKWIWDRFSRSTDVVNAFGTLLIGVATIALVASTIIQWRAFVTSDERSRRAWLSPIDLGIKGILGAEDNQNYLQLSVDYQNTGREPALNVAFYASAKLFDAASPKRLGDALNTLTAFDIPLLEENNECNNLLPLVSGATAYPSTAARYQVSSNIFPGKWSTTYEMTAWLIENEKILYVNGCFSYTTIEQTHYSKFCQYLLVVGGLLAETPFRNCPAGNWAD